MLQAHLAQRRKAAVWTLACTAAASQAGCKLPCLTPPILQFKPLIRRASLARHASDDDVLGPVHDVNKVLLVHSSQVPGAEPQLPVLVDVKNLRGLVRLLPVPRETAKSQYLTTIKLGSGACLWLGMPLPTIFRGFDLVHLE